MKSKQFTFTTFVFMRILVVVLALFCAQLCWAQKPTKENGIVVNEENVTHKFQTSQELLTPNVKDDITYFWYKTNQLYSTKGGYSGTLLHGNYTAYYLNNQLKEKGEFNKGVKTGEWKSWYENGQLSHAVSYKNGLKSGIEQFYDVTGKLTKELAYKKDELQVPEEKTERTNEEKEKRILPLKRTKRETQQTKKE